jgi:hypothetical protein
VASIDSVARKPLGRRLADLGRRQGLKLRVLAMRTRLDEELAAGVDPNSGPALALRAAQLLRPRYRRRLAAAVEHLVDEVDAHWGPRLSSAVPFRHDQVAEARGTLLSLAQVLRASEGVQPRGVAMVWQLLSDPASPLYLRTARGALEGQVQAALDSLVGQPWTSPGGSVARSPSALGGSNGDR